MKSFLILSIFLVSLVVFAAFPNTCTATGNDPLDTADFKLNQSLQILGADSDNDSVYLQAVKEGLEAVFVGNLIILPTQNDGSSNCVTCQLFNKTINKIDRLISGLSFHIIDHRDSPDACKSRVAAIKARNFVQLAKESMLFIGESTRICNPASADVDRDCAILNSPDRAGDVFDPTSSGTSPRHPFQGHREVRSPFFISSNVLDDSAGHEVVEKTSTLNNGQCTGILKEIRGIKVDVKPVILRIWEHPWFLGRELLESRLVWIWEWVPAEFLKTISICNNGGSLETTAKTQIVQDRQVNYLWKFVSER